MSHVKQCHHAPKIRGPDSTMFKVHILVLRSLSSVHAFESSRAASWSVCFAERR